MCQSTYRETRCNSFACSDKPLCTCIVNLCSALPYNILANLHPKITAIKFFGIKSKNLLTFQHFCVIILFVEISTSKGESNMTDRYEAFTTLINRINRNIRKIKNKEMAEYNLRSPHISCLYYLYKTNNLTATELCELCEEDKATISRSLDYLEKNGYLFCKCQSKKRYNSPFELTESGLIAGKKIADKIDLVLDKINDAISDKDREILYSCLNAISESIDRAVKEYE